MPNLTARRSVARPARPSNSPILPTNLVAGSSSLSGRANFHFGTFVKYQSRGTSPSLRQTSDRDKRIHGLVNLDTNVTSRCVFRLRSNRAARKTTPSIIYASLTAELHRRVEVAPRNILEKEELRDLRGCAIVETAFGDEVLRVAKSAEQDVEQRQVGIVVLMNAAAVMNTVALRPLHDVSQPLRRADVDVLNDGQEHRGIEEVRYGLCAEPDDHDKREA